MLLSKTLLFFFCLCCLVQTDQLLKSQEDEIFGFATSSGKQVVLARAKNDKYIVYRFGKQDKVELEFPEKKTESWSRFKYSFYLRPQQDGAEGMDNNYVSFVSGRFEYTLYETDVSTNDGKQDNRIGITVKDIGTGKVTDIQGVKSTQRGTLISLRDNGMIQKDD